jgi:hypothetical protein
MCLVWVAESYVRETVQNKACTDHGVSGICYNLEANRDGMFMYLPIRLHHGVITQKTFYRYVYVIV